MIARVSMIALCVGALGLSGCGKLGSLDQPAPMVGDKAKADYAQRQAEAARARAAKTPPADVTTVDSSYLPVQQAPYHPPVPGREDPYGPTGPVTALPQPGTPEANQ